MSNVSIDEVENACRACGLPLEGAESKYAFCTPCDTEIGEEWDRRERVRDAAPQLLQALLFARSVIKSGEKWTSTCEKVINGAIQQATVQVGVGTHGEDSQP